METKRSFTDIYMDMLNPLELEPVRKRNWNNILLPIALTTIYPISIVGAICKLKTSKKECDDRYGILPTLMAPIFSIYSVKELVHPSIKGLRVKNLEQLRRERVLFSELDGYNPAINFGTGKESPEFFGDETSVEGKKGYLELIFPDELIMGQNKPFYPANAGIHYKSSRHFLRVEPLLEKELYDLVKTNGVLDLRKK